MEEEVSIKRKRKSNKKRGSNNKAKFVYIISGIVLVLLIVILAVVGKPSDCYSIANKISNLLENSRIKDLGEDTEHKYSYIESFGIYTNEMGLNYDEEYAIMVFKFNSENESKQKEEYYNDMYQLLHKKINGTFLEKLEETKKYFDGEGDLIITNGIYLIRINSYYKNRYPELGKEINNIIKEYNISDIEKTNSDDAAEYWDEQLSIYEKSFINIYNESINSFEQVINDYLSKIDTCQGDDCEQYLNEILEYKEYQEVSDKVALVQNKYDEVMNRKKELVNSINSSIAKVERSLNQDDYDNVKEEIDNLNDSYYDKYKEEWLDRLEKVKEKTFKNSCKSYSYKDVLRTPDDYKGKNAYWFGVVYQKVSSMQYRVGVDCTKYQYIDGYSCKNTIYMYYLGNTNLIEDDVVKLWGTMNGTTTYTAVLGNSITIPTFYAEYVSLQ